MSLPSFLPTWREAVAENRRTPEPRRLGGLNSVWELAPPVGAACKGDSQKRAERDGDSPSDLHLHLLL